MEENKKQFVQNPDPKEEDCLILSDRLIYANMRRFMNKTTYEAYPSISTIARLSGYSEKKVKQSIQRLIKNKDIELLQKKHGRNNIYKFNKLTKNFEKFTYEFLDNDKLTPDEKAYVVGFQSLAYKDEQHSICSLSNTDIAKELNIDEHTVAKYNRALVKKEIMEEVATQARDGFGFRKVARTIDNVKICQAILFIKEDVDRHDAELKDIRKTIEIILKENRDLKKELYKQNYTEVVQDEYAM